MRRGSLIGPMLLIRIGVLFLINNLRPELPILQMIGDYWPFVLIAWGALRLLEITWWYLSGREVPGNGVSGGEWGLVIFLCIFGTALFYDPLVCKKINEGIAAYLAKHGMQSVAELIGTSSAHPPLEEVSSVPGEKTG